MIKRLLSRGFLLILLSVICIRGVLVAQTATFPSDLEQLDEYIKRQIKQQASSKFENLGFGIAFTASTFFKNFVTEAEVESGNIRLIKQQYLFGDIMLETHKFWSLATKKYEGKYFTFDSITIGVGPFFGVLIDSNSSTVINALASGLMFGFRPDTSSPNSLNIGIGLTARFKMSELRSDLTLDGPLPVGVPGVKYQESTNVGLTLVFSFTWANL